MRLFSGKKTEVSVKRISVSNAIEISRSMAYVPMPMTP